MKNIKVHACLTVSNSTASPSRSIVSYLAFSYSLDSLKRIRRVGDWEKWLILTPVFRVVRGGFGELDAPNESYLASESSLVKKSRFKKLFLTCVVDPLILNKQIIWRPQWNHGLSVSIDPYEETYHFQIMIQHTNEGFMISDQM